MATNKKSFEEYILELEDTVKALETKDISLEDAVKNYTSGIEISKKCYEILSKNEELVITKMAESNKNDNEKE